MGYGVWGMGYGAWGMGGMGMGYGLWAILGLWAITGLWAMGYGVCSIQYHTCALRPATHRSIVDPRHRRWGTARGITGTQASQVGHDRVIAGKCIVHATTPLASVTHHGRHAEPKHVCMAGTQGLDMCSWQLGGW